MYGAARGLVRAQAGRWLAGAVVFMAVPAEEYVELEYRQRLRREGQVSFFGGKQELLARGEFADVDLALMVHQAVLTEGRKFLVGGTSNGFVGKLIRYRGREAHAGGAPHAGVNALNAAILGLMGVHLLRETFRDEDSIRVHPIITKGGDLVNVIPADVRAETYVRGRTLGAIIEANRKVNRALRAGAAAIGAEVEITKLPGYLPRRNDARLDALFRANAVALVGEEAVGEGKHGSGSSDMGDIMHVMPGIHPTVGGCEGRGHSEDFGICDPDTAYVLAAKALALTVVDLLWGRAEAARDICRAFDGQYSREEYLRMWAEVLGTAE
jgi:metal-dependent amidase/aminoacylase/carboxypeptidase family protein